MPNSDTVKFIDSEVYVLAFLGVLTLVLLCELQWPRRRNEVPLAARWRTNFSLFLTNTLIGYFLLPIGAVAVALFARDSGWGLFNWLHTPYALAFIFSVLFIDLAKYIQHYLLHRIPLLWRLHRAHHTDSSCDVTTSLRFHPGEALLAELIELAIILACGAPPLAVACYRVARIGVSTLVHGNIGLGATAELWLGRVVITPDLHRIHHSSLARETNSNFSGGLIWWDWLFGTYRARPEGGHQGMAIGIEGYSPQRANRLGLTLADPFHSQADER